MVLRRVPAPASTADARRREAGRAFVVPLGDRRPAVPYAARGRCRRPAAPARDERRERHAACPIRREGRHRPRGPRPDARLGVTGSRVHRVLAERRRLTCWVTRRSSRRSP